MFSPEQAQRELQKVIDPKGHEKRAERVAKLPAKMQSLWTRFSTNWHAAAPQLSAEIEALGPEGRRQWFEALSPQLGDAIEAGWTFFRHQPYQSGYGRRPFRSPGLSETGNVRLSWLQTILQQSAMYQQDVEWYAVWIPYAGSYYGGQFAHLFAAVIEQGGSLGDRIFDILLKTAKGEHQSVCSAAT